MSFRWEAYLELAQQLTTGSSAPPVREAGALASPEVEREAKEQGEQSAAPPDPSEAALRTAVSRAYYSAYHLARDYVVSNSLGSVGKLESHQDVWRAFGAGQRRRQERRIGLDGLVLHKMRKAADYEIDLPSWSAGPAPAPTPESRRRHWKGQADLALKHAQTIRELLGQLNPRN